MNNNNTIQSFNKFVKKKTVEEPQQKKVLIYTRVSSKNQAENKNSLITQERVCAEYCKANSLEILDFFGGTYESAKGDFSRKEFMKLIENATNRKPKPYGIVVWSISRFSRSGGNAIGILTKLVEDHGIHLMEASNGIDTTTARGFLSIQEKLLKSREENLTRAENIIPNMQEFLANGNWFGRAPIGYDHYGPRVKDSKFLLAEQKIEINHLGRLLQEAFQYKLTGNYSDVKIIDILNKRGFKISKQRISSVWKNPFYAGVSKNSLLKDGNAIRGKWEPLITEKDFWKLQDLLNVRASGYQHQKVADYKPLNRLVKCNDCGTYLVGYLVKKKNLGYYKCPDCNGVSMNCETTPKAKRIGAHDLFTTLLEKYQVQPQFKNLLITQLTKIYGYYNTTEIQKSIDCKKILDELKKKLNDMTIKYSIGDLKEEYFKKGEEELERRIFDQQQELNKTQPEISNLEKMIEKSVERLQNISKIWGSVGLEDKRNLQRTLFPDGIYYDVKNHQYLTKEINSFVLISQTISKDYEVKKKGINQVEPEISPSVARTRFEPGTSGL
jgi:DNA invertase Pin-like site-specific DNA recombinase